MIGYFLYNIILLILFPFIYIGFIFHNKGREHLLQQLKSIRDAKKIMIEKKNSRKVVIFHAASAGEFEQIKPILKRIDRDKYFLLQTFYSPTIYNKEKNTILADAICYHPLDFIWSAIYFFWVFKPDFFIITRHDIWPNHLIFAKLFGARTHLINANLHKESLRLISGFKESNKWLFRKFDSILTGSERLKNNLMKIVRKGKIEVSGDSRFDQIIDRIGDRNSDCFPKDIYNSQNIILGSIIPSDYNVIFQGIKKFFPQGKKSLAEQKRRIIIVPHEIRPLHLKKIEKELNKIDMQYAYFSDIKNKIPENIIIVDSVGILADLYKYGDVAYVGAGFGAGVHSVIEPAVHKCVVSFGPNISILDEAISMHDLQIGIMVKNGEDFFEFLKILDNPEELTKLKEQTTNFIDKNINNSNHIISLIFG